MMVQGYKTIQYRQMPFVGKTVISAGRLLVSGID
jgi:hypothetical protein